MVETLAKRLHDEWLREHADESDEANTSYDDLSEEWKTENRAAAEVVTDILTDNDGDVSLEDAEVYNRVGRIIHEAWLCRNKGDERELGQEVRFEDLSQEEKEKDISQVRVGKEVFRELFL